MIRRLGPDEFELLREVRLAALVDAPDAFGSSYAKEVAFSEDEWRHRLRPDGNPAFIQQSTSGVDQLGADGLVVAAEDVSGAEGLWLVAMWVRPAARRAGVGDALVARVLEWAAAHSHSRVRLTVIDGNASAERLYARHGFARTGRSEVRDRDGAVEIEMQATIDRSA